MMKALRIVFIISLLFLAFSVMYLAIKREKTPELTPIQLEAEEIEYEYFSG